MASYEVTLKDHGREVIDGADAYQQEGQMTTFFATASERALVDSWSTRIASFRTTEVLVIRRRPDPVPVPVDDDLLPARAGSAGSPVQLRSA